MKPTKVAQQKHEFRIMKRFREHAKDYVKTLAKALESIPIETVEALSVALLECWRDGKQVFIFGNGGSAGNAIHLANDFLYGISKELGHALRVHALPANSAVLTCLANDEGYNAIFYRQLAVLAQPGDIAVAFSGSGNSPNVVSALEWCKKSGVKTFAVLGYDGGAAKTLADTVIHVPVRDMQISEDVQLIVGHMIMQWLYKRGDEIPCKAAK